MKLYLGNPLRTITSSNIPIPVKEATLKAVSCFQHYMLTLCWQIALDKPTNAE